MTQPSEHTRADELKAREVAWVLSGVFPFEVGDKECSHVVDPLRAEAVDPIPSNARWTQVWVVRCALCGRNGSSLYSSLIDARWDVQSFIGEVVQTYEVTLPAQAYQELMHEMSLYAIPSDISWGFSQVRVYGRTGQIISVYRGPHE